MAGFLDVLGGRRVDPPPVWLMRQAGRYLPEYRASRQEAGSFLDLVYNPAFAQEVTLQPIRRFGFDAAILFSDILVVAHALGQDLWFAEGEGPQMAPALETADLAALTPDFARLNPVYETVRLLRASLPADVPLIGFAGSPWTVATYMIHGRGSRDHAAARLMAYREPARMNAILEAIVGCTVHYLDRQIAAGAQVLQLFDSWSGVLAPPLFESLVIQPTRQIVRALKSRHPQVPIIGFPRGAGTLAVRYAAETGVDALGLDETMDPDWMHAALPPGFPVQGNVDPVALRAGAAALDQAVDACLAAFAGRPHILNLGHGITPDVPVAHVAQLVARVRGKD